MTLAALDVPAIEETRQRLPERGNVPQEAEDALEPPEGPLEGEDHSTGEDILKPSARDTVATVVEHPTVADMSDVADELDVTKDIAERALALHDIEDPDGVTDDVPEGVIEVPLAGDVDTDHLRDPAWSDGRLLEHLAVRCQYGVADIKTLLERERNHGRSAEKPQWTVRTEDIENALREVGLMERKEREARTLESEDHRLPKVGHDFSETGDSSPSGGLTVNTADFD